MELGGTEDRLSQRSPRRVGWGPASPGSRSQGPPGHKRCLQLLPLFLLDLRLLPERRKDGGDLEPP